MTRRRSTWSVLVLLAAFLAGGVVAPALHRHEHLRRAVHHHSAAVPGADAAAVAPVDAGGGFLVGELGLFADGPCALHAVPLVSAVVEAPHLPRPYQGATVTVPAPRRLSSHRPSHAAIRGPPGSA